MAHIFRKDQYFNEKGQVIFHLKSVSGTVGEAEFYGVTEVVLPDVTEDVNSPDWVKNPKLPTKLPFIGVSANIGLGAALEKCFNSYDEVAAKKAAEVINEFKVYKANAQAQAESTLAVETPVHALHPERHVAKGQEANAKHTKSILVP